MICNNGFCELDCTPDCDGKNCGSDGCGGTCGDNEGQCADAQDACVEGVCTCQGSCDGKVCGDDGCGNSCGTCDGNDECQGGQCVCIPDCANSSNACGDDGCGGSCGTCAIGPCGSNGTCACNTQCATKECGDTWTSGSGIFQLTGKCNGQCGRCSNNGNDNLGSVCSSPFGIPGNVPSGACQCPINATFETVCQNSDGTGQKCGMVCGVECGGCSVFFGFSCGEYNYCVSTIFLPPKN